MTDERFDELVKKAHDAAVGAVQVADGAYVPVFSTVLGHLVNIETNRNIMQVRKIRELLKKLSEAKVVND